MKKIAIVSILLFGILSFKNTDAQIRVNLGVNIGSQPEWGPVGYDHVDYYYLPEIQTYYDVRSHLYVYYENNVWVRRAYLPVRYNNYDIYHGYKVVINERRPWERNDIYRTRYSSYADRRNQVIIRDSRDEKYARHWNKKWEKEDKKERKDEDKNLKEEDKQWKKDHKHDN
jgi:hypothetical protein